MVDKQLITDFYQNDKDSVIEITVMVKGQIPLVIQDIQNAVSNKDLNDLNAKLHFHGPSFTYAGLPQITEEIRVIEELSLFTNNMADIEPHVSNLKQTLTRAEVALSNYIQNVITW